LKILKDVLFGKLHLSELSSSIRKARVI